MTVIKNRTLNDNRGTTAYVNVGTIFMSDFYGETAFMSDFYRETNLMSDFYVVNLNEL